MSSTRPSHGSTDHMRPFTITSEHTLAQERSIRGAADLLTTAETARNPLSALTASVDPEGGELGSGPHASRRVISIEELRPLFAGVDDDDATALALALGEHLAPASELWAGMRCYPWNEDKASAVLALLSAPGGPLEGVSLGELFLDGRSGSVLVLDGRHARLDTSVCEEMCRGASTDDERLLAVALWLAGAARDVI